MLTKGNNTKQFIIEKSKKLFSKQGYTTVTMKDVCMACGLSRGGLYRYFGSTKEIFLEILNEDKEDKDQLLIKSIKENVPALQIFKGFLKDRKETLILGDCRGFSFAVQEFTKQEISQREHLKKRINQAKEGLILLLEYGQKQGEFKIFDNECMALTILLFLDSLEVNAYILDFTEKEVDMQLDFLLQLIQL
ncbi:MAG: TetR/AcrR family transcriptional regulator [Eubacteriales bacterium]|nr:TetR/AcrR family transcriptional regulator [Eubacteriales bacterium]